MQLSKPKKIYDLDRFLPLDGESGVEIKFSDGILNLSISYENHDEVLAKRDIRFFHAKYFFKGPFPGYSFFSSLDGPDLSLLNSLVQYESSDLLEIESGGVMEYKHYRLFLHSTGIAIHVIANSCEVFGEVLID
jgi:hypothetical protein